MLLVFVHGLFSGRLERTVVTAPVLFTGAGILVFAFLPGLLGRRRLWERMPSN